MDDKQNEEQGKSLVDRMIGELDENIDRVTGSKCSFRFAPLDHTHEQESHSHGFTKILVLALLVAVAALYWSIGPRLVPVEARDGNTAWRMEGAGASIVRLDDAVTSQGERLKRIELNHDQAVRELALIGGGLREEILKVTQGFPARLDKIEKRLMEIEARTSGPAVTYSVPQPATNAADAKATMSTTLQFNTAPQP